MKPSLLALPDHRINHEQAQVFLDKQGPWDEKNSSKNYLHFYCRKMGITGGSGSPD